MPEGEELTAKAQEAESQLERYKKQPNNIKSLIDSEEARLFWAVFHKGANEPKLLIETRSEFYAFQLDHSSICLPSVSRRSFAIQKQKEDYFLLVKENCLRDIENLLSKNISVEIKDKYGRTPSHYAAKCARLDIVNLFYQKGANFKAKDKNGEMPLDFINLFLKGSGKDVSDSNKVWLKSWKPLHYAAYNNNVGIVQKIFELLFNESNKDINVRDGKYGYAPLNVAVYYNRTGMVELLLNKNANIETEDIYGRTPLHHAVRYSTLNMTRLLCEKGANIKAKNKKGEIPLCIANQYDKVDMINFLLDRGTNIEASDFNDNTVLKLAYCIKGVMDKTNNNVPPDFAKLKNKLPKSVKNVVFALEVCITSVYSNEYLYAAANDFKYNKNRRRVFTWVPSKENNPPGSCAGDKQAIWKVQPYGDNLCITSVYSNEYLYAAANDLKYNENRRRVFTWVPSKENNPPGSCAGDKQAIWKVQPYGDNLCITNVYSNEYLYAATNDLKYNENRRRVFTWVPSKENNPPGSCARDKQAMWKVEDYGSIRKRRDIQELESKMSLNSGLYIDVNITDKNYSSRKPLAIDSSNQPEIVASSGTRPSSWINDLFGWIKGSVDGLFGSKPTLSEETSSTSGTISQIDAPMDVNGTIMLLDVLVRKVTGQKYISIVDQSISPLEARGYALNIIEKFEKVLNETAIKSGISVTNLNFDPVAVQSAIVGQIISEKFSKIPKTLYSFAKEACPEFQQTDKFLAHLRSNLESEKEAILLQQKVEKPSKILDQQVSGKVELSKKPDTFLNGASVVKGISNVLEL